MLLTRRNALAALTVASLSLSAPPIRAGVVKVRRKPAGLDYSLSHASDAGRYFATAWPDLSPLRTGTLHSWQFGLTDKDGLPVADVPIRVDGGMPQHGHGLPTRPRVTGLGDGQYRVDGMKFNMPGWWVVYLLIDAPDGADRITFNLEL